MIVRAVLFLFLARLAFSNALLFTVDEECLNYTVYPTQYDITIIPFIMKERPSSYDCEVSIMVIANAPGIQTIELDAANFQILRLEVLDGIMNIINKYRPYEYDVRTSKLKIYLAEQLLPYKESGKQYKINIMIRKLFTPDGKGITLVPYEGDSTKHMILTRLSPYNAKHFFPCFDNPRFESGFKFRVYVFPKDMGVEFFNTSLVIAKELVTHHNHANGTMIIEYLPSPQVALYQVGFHYSMFSNRQFMTSISNDTFVLWAPRNKLLLYDFFMSFSEVMLNMIIKYSQSHRPVVNGPINVVAVPANIEGFEVGSWNLWTNGEALLAHNPMYTSINQEERMKFEVTQHMCRVWLGNPGELSRTKWTEEWFREGVATYLAYYLLAQYNHGAYKFKQRWPMAIYGIEMKYRAMAQDWHHSTPALATFNRSLAIEIPDRYKELVTMKTASILWMIENWVDSEKFHNSLVHFINTRRGLGISLNNFMISLDLDTVECQHQFFNGSTASKILNSWFHQSGYPVINVNVLRDRTPNAIQLKQQKFSFVKDHHSESRFLIPISYVVQKKENCLNCHRPRFTIGQVYTFGENLDGGWILLNRNAAGYYRVNYDDHTWLLIAQSLKKNPQSIDALSRAQIVNDVFALFVSGEMDLALAFEILNYLDLEMERVVWEAAMSGYELLKIPGAACNMTKILYQEWQKFLRNKLTPLYHRVSMHIEMDQDTRLFRSRVINFACQLKHPTCESDMRIMINYSKTGRARMDPDTREACYYTYVSDTGSFEGLGFNTFEVEDKRIVEHKKRLERNFLLNIPVGHPLVEKLVMTTTPTTFVTEDPRNPPSKESLTDGAYSFSMPSYFVAALSAFIIAVAR